jgi:hypothetical protein
MKKTPNDKKKPISAHSLRQFADNRRIFNKAVNKAVEENRKLGISDEEQFSP